MSPLLDAVEETARRLAVARADVTEILADRNQAIRDAYNGGIGVRHIENVAGLTRIAIYKMLAKGK